jgi:hypothetical protein
MRMSSVATTSLVSLLAFTEGLPSIVRHVVDTHF